MRRWALGVGIVVILAAPVRAAGVEYVPVPPPPAAPTHFCGGGAASDRLTPFKPRPRLHSPSMDGRIGFGPPSLIVTRLPFRVVGGGSVGYSLTLRENAAAVDLDWDVTTNLTLVDWRGNPLRELKGAHRRLRTVTEGTDAGISFSVKDVPAFYRLATTFRDEAGKRLGGIGFYFRSVPWTGGAHLVLTSNSYHLGETVIGRVDNLGPEAVLYGEPFAIERQEGPRWGPAPESPRGPWIMVGYITPPGYAGKNCSRFHIPPAMRPGRYRMSKDYGTRVNFRPEDDLTAEFSVLPAG